MHGRHRFALTLESVLAARMWIAMFAAASVIAPSGARAERCEEAALRAAVEGLGRDGRSLLGPLRDAPRSTASLAVSVHGPTIVDVAYGPVVRAGCVAAVLRYRYVIYQEDRAGLDVYFPPLITEGVAIVVQDRRRLRRVARFEWERGALHGDPDATALRVEDQDGDGRAEIVVDEGNGRLRVLGLEHGRIVAREAAR